MPALRNAHNANTCAHHQAQGQPLLSLATWCPHAPSHQGKATGGQPHRSFATTCSSSAVMIIVSVTAMIGIAALAAGVAVAMLGAASFFSDLTMPISWNTCVEIGRRIPQRFSCEAQCTRPRLGRHPGKLTLGGTAFASKSFNNSGNIACRGARGGGRARRAGPARRRRGGRRRRVTSCAATPVHPEVLAAMMPYFVEQFGDRKSVV